MDLYQQVLDGLAEKSLTSVDVGTDMEQIKKVGILIDGQEAFGDVQEILAAINAANNADVASLKEECKRRSLFHYVKERKKEVFYLQVSKMADLCSIRVKARHIEELNTFFRDKGILVDINESSGHHERELFLAFHYNEKDEIESLLNEWKDAYVYS